MKTIGIVPTNKKCAPEVIILCSKCIFRICLRLQRLDMVQSVNGGNILLLATPQIFEADEKEGGGLPKDARGCTTNCTRNDERKATSCWGLGSSASSLFLVDLNDIILLHLQL